MAISMIAAELSGPAVVRWSDAGRGTHNVRDPATPAPSENGTSSAPVGAQNIGKVAVSVEVPQPDASGVDARASVSWGDAVSHSWSAANLR